MFLFPVTKAQEKRVGRSVQKIIWTLKFWPRLTTPYPPDVEQYCKTPLISTYVFSGLATVQVLIFRGPYLLSGGMIRRGEKIQQG